MSSFTHFGCPVQGPELFDFSEVCSFAVFSYFCPDVIQEKILFCQAAVSDRDCRVYIIVVIAKEDYVICILQAPSKVVDVRPWIIVSVCIKASGFYPYPITMILYVRAADFWFNLIELELFIQVLIENLGNEPCPCGRHIAVTNFLLTSLLRLIAIRLLSRSDLIIPTADITFFNYYFPEKTIQFRSDHCIKSARQVFIDPELASW